MYNIAICEDESVDLDILLRHLKNYEKETSYKFIIDTFKSAEEFIKSDILKYNIVILDIYMNGMNGVDAAKRIRKSNERCKIIFVTALEKYSIEGYKVNAHRYILKPVEKEEFIESIESIIEELEKENIFIETNHKQKITKVKISDMYYLEISNRKTLIYTKNQVYASNTPLNKWNDILYKYGFSSSHKSFLINMKYIDKIERDHVVLSNNSSVPISKRRYKQFKNEFTRYIGMIL